LKQRKNNQNSTEEAVTTTLPCEKRNIMKKLITFQIIVVFLVAICTMSSAHAGGWKKSYQAGTTDKNGHYMGGTEIMFLTPHEGMLYAGTSLLFNTQGDKRDKGAQILVKESADRDWKLDYQADIKNMRVDALNSFTFHTDGKGTDLKQPVTLLIAGLMDNTPMAEAAVYVRNDKTNQWTRIVVDAKPTNFAADRFCTVRALAQHRDRVTGVDRAFAGAYPGGIYSGVYDATISGNIRWDKAPEFSDYEERVMSFGECNGDLYVAIKPAIYKRVDGTTPSWVKVYEYELEGMESRPSSQGGSSGMRGLTAIKNPKGSGEVLLMALESAKGKILYLDPSDKYKETVELDVNSFLNKQWGKRKESIKLFLSIIALDSMEQVVDPKTGKQAFIMGAFFILRNGSPQKSGWYLIRHANGTYTLNEVPYIYDKRRSSHQLAGVRSIRISPFPSDQGSIFYFGGYGSSPFFDEHNTGWIYRADLYTVLGIANGKK
jgi:hypothetical protein